MIHFGSAGLRYRAHFTAEGSYQLQILEVGFYDKLLFLKQYIPISCTFWLGNVTINHVFLRKMF